MKQQPLGEYLRQIRRQHGFTQSELGGHKFSKSYISAVERNRVTPSRSALLHFAEKLQQPVGDFEHLLQQTEESEQAQIQPVVAALPEEHEQEILSLLDVILKGKQSIPLTLPAQLVSFSLLSSSVPSEQKRQARLLFLNGLVQQKNGELAIARTTLERALALATPDYHLFICNALGTNYALTHDYIRALQYHQRALTLLKTYGQGDVDLLEQLTYHCGDDYRGLGYHSKARLYFEEAIRHLQATSNIANAGKLYLGLGYSTYAALFQQSKSISTGKQLMEENEHAYQLAVGYLLQSRTLYQISSDFIGEMHARLIQTMVLLDWSYGKYYELSENMFQDKYKARLLGGANLLDDASEQCKQIILKLRESYGETPHPPMEIRSIAIMSIAYLIQVAVRRAIQARTNNYTDTSTKERSLAINLCEWLLAFLTNEGIDWYFLQRCIQVSGNNINYRARSIASFQAIKKATMAMSDNAQTLTLVSFTIGLLAEEIALADEDDNRGNERFQLADQCFQQALESALHEVPDSERDTSYTFRVYQRYITILEKRMRLVPDNEKSIEHLFLTIIEAFLHLPSFLLLSLLENQPS